MVAGFTDSHIREELKRCNYDISKAARQLGIPFEALNKKYGVLITPIVIPKEPIPADIKSLGKEGLKEFVIAVKANTSPWPLRFFAAIRDARVKYDKGTHEMCQQKRTDGWIVLYLIPRGMPIRRDPYFFGSVRKFER